MFNINEINKSVIPKLKAIDSSPFDVSRTIPVVIVLVRFSILPPTIIIAPTSDRTLPNATSVPTTISLLDSQIIVNIVEILSE